MLKAPQALPLPVTDRVVSARPSRVTDARREPACQRIKAPAGMGRKTCFDLLARYEAGENLDHISSWRIAVDWAVQVREIETRARIAAEPPRESGK